MGHTLDGGGRWRVIRLFEWIDSAGWVGDMVVVGGFLLMAWVLALMERKEGV